MISFHKMRCLMHLSRWLNLSFIFCCGKVIIGCWENISSYIERGYQDMWSCAISSISMIRCGRCFLDDLKVNLVGQTGATSRYWVWIMFSWKILVWFVVRNTQNYGIEESTIFPSLRKVLWCERIFVNMIAVT